MKKKSKKKVGKPTCPSCNRVVTKMGQCGDCKKSTRKFKKV